MLYEMLTGRRAFQRETSAETMTAILKEDPPELAGTRAEISPALDRIIRHCLEKNPVERFHSARDVAFALSALSGSQVSSGAAAAAVAASSVRSRRYLVGGILAAVAFAAGALVTRQLTPAPARIAFETRTLDPMWITRARFAHPRLSTVPQGLINKGYVKAEPLYTAYRHNAAGMDLALHRAVAFPSLVYRPRRPEQEVLHTIVRDHYETFRAQAAGDT